MARASRIPFEYYETPITFGRYLFRHVPIYGHCFEPMVGRGAIVEASEVVGGSRQWTTNDLDQRWPANTHLDATDPKTWARPAGFGADWVITNPAFSLAIPLLDRALPVARVGIACYLRISIFEVLKEGPRRSWMHDHPPNEVHFLPRFAYQRNSRGQWVTDSVTSCWAIWRKGDRSQSIHFAPESLLAELDAETPIYRARMDQIMRERAA